MRLALGIAATLILIGCRSTADSTWVEHALAQNELERGRPEEAIRILEDCRRRSPDYALTYLSLAAAWARQGNTDAFRENLEKYLTLNPSHYVAGLYLAEAQFKQSDLPAARKTYEAYLASEKGVDAKSLSRREHALSRLAEIAQREGDDLAFHRRTAEAQYQEALAQIASAGDQDLRDEQKLQVQSILESALAEFAEAKKTAADDPELERQTRAAEALLEDVNAGQTAKIAMLLSTAQPTAGESAPAPLKP